MKKIIVQIAITALLLANISCSNEKEVVTEEELTVETSSVIVNKLPADVVKAEELLLKNNISIKEKDNSVSERLGDNTTQGTGTYKKFFIVFPPDWNYSKRLNYLNLAKQNTIRDIYVDLDICEYIDTWYIEILSTDPFVKNKAKNVVKASTTNVDPDETMTNEEDEPGVIEGNNGSILKTVEFYNNCYEIPLPPEYDIVIIDGGSGNSNTGGGPDNGPNDDPNIPQQ